MLHDGRDTVRRDAVRAVLKAFDGRANECGDELGIGAERAGDTRPARLGRKIGLRRQRHVNAHGAIFLTRDVRELPHQLDIAERGEAERFRPLRKSAAAVARAEHDLEVTARIGTDGHGNAEPRALGDLLNAIVLLGDLRRRQLQSRDEAVDVLRGDGAFRRLEVIAFGRRPHRRTDTGQRSRASSRRLFPRGSCASRDRLRVLPA